MQKVIVVLGSENTSTGELGSIAKDRLLKCLEVFSDEYVIACSGGWGEHFNTTNNSHAFYAIEFLKAMGISEKVILPPILSGHTVDDAVKTKDYFKSPKEYELFVLTSDFHLERAELIFKEILNDYKLHFLSAKSSLPCVELKAKIEHEKKSVHAIIEKGLYY